MITNRISFRSGLRGCLFSAIFAAGLWGGVLRGVESPSLQCVNSYDTIFNQQLDIDMVVLTDSGTSTTSHDLVVSEGGTNRASYSFDVAADGSVSGGAVVSSTPVKDAKGNVIYYRSVLGPYVFTGNNQGQPSFLEGPPSNIAPYAPAVDVLNFGVDGISQQIKITSTYSYSDWKDIGPFIDALPYTPGATGAAATSAELIFDLRKVRQDPTAPITCSGGCSSCNPHMAGASLDRFHAGITITDTPVGYTPGVGMPMNFTVSYQQRLNDEPTTFHASNLGPQWRAGWIAFISGGPTDGPKTAAVDHESSGSTSTFGGYQQTVYYGLGATPANTGDFTNNNGWNHATLHYRQGPERYELWMPDGSVQIFAQAVGTAPNRTFYLTSLTDAQGNVTQLSYDPHAAADGNAVLMTVTDPTGSQLIFGYSGSDPLKIVQVTRSKDGLSARFQYTGGYLTAITDPIGITSSFHYATGTGFIDQMTTPYGTTTFSSTDGPGYLEADMTNPLGQTERVEYREALTGTMASTDSPAPTATGSLVINNANLDLANSFYWTRRAIQQAAADGVTTDTGTFFSNYAQVTHWAQSGQGSIPVALSMKMPLEGRVWYNYPGQSDDVVDVTAAGVTTSPSATARYLDGGATQASFASYNANGLITQSVDPLGRTTNYTYDTNGIDLLNVKQVDGGGSDTLSTMTYNSAHLPLTVTDASGQTTTMTYNAQGQLLTRTNAKSETTTLAYNSSSYLASVTGPVSGATTTYTYDSAGRVQTVTDSEGYVLTTAYDNLDRPVSTTYPDSTTDRTVYGALDVIKTIDRNNHATYNKYDAIRELIQTTDPLGRTTKYSWCTCGGLSTLTDANGNVTTWGLDLQGRVTSKTYADSSAINYTYETNTGRLHTMTDALGSVATYSYNADNTLAATSYAPGSGVASTPNVSFGYDSVYNRVAWMADGTGTTTYAYNSITGTVTTGAGRLSSVSVPIASSTGTITYSYDELGRVTERDVDHVATGANDTSTTFDTLGRVTGVTNALGAFTYAYVDTTSRLSEVTYPNWQKTDYSYYDNTGDQRLKCIKNYVWGMFSNTPLSKFDYAYNPVGTIASWTQQADSSTAVVNTLSYDNADQLVVAAAVPSGGTGTTNQYNYDPAGNRLAETTLSGTTVTGVTGGLFNNLNQLTTLGGSTTLTTVSGTTSLAASSVIVNGVTATVTGTAYSATIPTVTGTNILNITAKPTSGAPVTQRFAATISGSATTALSYDANGNTTTDEKGNTYTWDALNRLTKITYPDTSYSTFAYDGLSRRTQIAEYDSSHSLTSTKNYLWIGSEIAEERDSSNAVTKRFFPQGEQQAGTNYYYSRDHEASIREMLNSSGTIVARYSYDPYGRTTLVSGSNLATKQYAGYYAHQTSGFSLTDAGDGSSTGRLFDPATGRWLSRDPVGMAGGINLYGYVGENPENLFDPFGEKECLPPVQVGPKHMVSDQIDSRIPTGRGTKWQDAGILHGYVVIGLPEAFVIIQIRKRLVEYVVRGHTTYWGDFKQLCRCDANSPWIWVDLGGRNFEVPYSYTTLEEEQEWENIDKPDEDTKNPKPIEVEPEPLPPEVW